MPFATLEKELAATATGKARRPRENLIETPRIAGS
jgi:hypothetical protein